LAGTCCFATPLVINETNEEYFYYCFVTSEGNEIINPVVLRLNGCSGCSSFDDFIYGPFNFEAKENGGLWNFFWDITSSLHCKIWIQYERDNIIHNAIKTFCV
jgi:hypothetical protein